jgi:hypothetical protein
MIEKDYLPQYAAEAVRDLEEAARRAPAIAQSNPQADAKEMHIVTSTFTMVANLLRTATHIVLPPNGEIYRDSKHTGPTDQECVSITGLPAPITSFEYPWTHDMNGHLNPTYEYRGEQSQLQNPPKRITLVVDEKQFVDHKPIEDGRTRIIFLGIYYYPTVRRWCTAPFSVSIFDPLRVKRGTRVDTGNKFWSTEVQIMNMLTQEYLDQNDARTGVANFSEYQADISLVAQACHALRVGATLETRKEKSYTRTRTFEKAGVGGFEYHVLKLPHGTVKETLGTREGSERDGPRYHFRRAHLRNLSTGAQTFVRSCFVGNREKGVVEKTYRMEKEVAA